MSSLPFNLFLDKLPTTVEVGGLFYRLNTSFKACIGFERIMSDSALKAEDKLYLVLKLFYGDAYIEPGAIEEAIDRVLWFYRGGEDIQKEDSEVVHSNKKAIYSFLYDDALIYSAFLKEYDIDLVASDLHWFLFRSLFLSLSDKTKLSEVMAIRAMKLSVVPREDKKRIMCLKRLYALPDMRTLEEKEHDFANAFWTS